jgi:hypothetical protein
MAIFSEKVQSAKFIDSPTNTLIEILYKEGDDTIPYIVEVDFTQNDFQELMQEISLDEIEENTKTLLEQEGKFFESAISAEMDRRWALEHIKADKIIKERTKELELKFDETTHELQSMFNSEEKENSNSKFTGKDLIDIINGPEDKDFIFNTKIAILEDPEIVKSKDKELKLKIRKSKTIAELLNIYTSTKIV